MKYLTFELCGDMAMWRNPYESMGSFSCLGPAPSNIAGIIGAALGFASPRSQAASEPDNTALKSLDKNGLPWPVSPELLHWQQENDYHVACRWLGKHPRRVPWNINGFKNPTKYETLRLQQQVIINPRYEVVLRLPEDTAQRVGNALRLPAFPLFLGASFCPAIVRNVRISDAFPDAENWAYHKPKFVFGEATPLSRHIVDADTCFERIRSDGYWVYPTPEMPGELQDSPLMKGYCCSDSTADPSHQPLDHNILKQGMLPL